MDLGSSGSSLLGFLLLSLLRLLKLLERVLRQGLPRKYIPEIQMREYQNKS